MTLDRVRDGTSVFIDATIFIYHFTGASPQCRSLLERCERGVLRGATSVVVLAEVAHRLMMIEAVVRKLVTGGNLAKKLRAQPAIVRQLHTYREQVERIPLMGIAVLPLDLKAILGSAALRRQHGLLTNDSLVAFAARDAGIRAVASADPDLARVPDLQVFSPSDLGQA